ncbi:hypothetical protein NW198_01760 [Thermophilibacter sp. ET337]|uniref:hypothetical protein n=1 Tax=Thermophilibacter sp. ET337 TaxID=2973084 RepID=UPI0021ABA36E|nr:hypothetical protein [Thermophilibacter sp. ET337]MCR8907346.1 hypothetical protein [Thermophilibacter sp. ET337]
MRRREKRALEEALRDHYRALRGTDAAVPRALVEAVAAEMDRPSRPRAAEVVAGQARRIGAGAWALHAALVLLAVPCALSGIGVGTVAAALGAALALASLAGVTRSRSCGMAELEASCPVNAQAAACARGLVLCCADALALALLAAFAEPVGGTPWAVLAQGLAPYLAALGAGLLAARRAASPDATVAAVSAAAGVCAACALARTLCPAAFGPAAALAWWAAAAAALAFAAAQARAWLRAAASGFADAPASAGAL